MAFLHSELYSYPAFIKEIVTILNEGGTTMIDRNNTNGNNMIPFFVSDLDANAGVKLNEDTYEVFVNGSFVGRKTLKNQGENLSDIDDFLRNQGFSDFTTSVDGDHYMIEAGNQQKNYSNALSVYFNNR